MTTLGERARDARKSRKWTLDDVCAMVADLDGGIIAPGTLQRMETGERPGEPRVWGAIWKALGLPLRELYQGLGLPVADSEPSGTIGEILSVARSLNADGQALLLMFARHTPSYQMVAGAMSAMKADLDPEEEYVNDQVRAMIAQLKKSERIPWLEEMKAHHAADQKSKQIADGVAPIPKTADV